MNKTALGLMSLLMWVLGLGSAIADDTLPLAPGTATVNGNRKGQTAPQMRVNLDSGPASFIQNADGTPTLPAPSDATEPNSSAPPPPPKPKP